MDIDQIIAALEESKGPDKRIDFWISCRIFDPSPHTDEELNADIDLVGLDNMVIKRPFTSSVDAAIELCGKIMPGWGGFLDFGGATEMYVCDIMSPERAAQTGDDEEEHGINPNHEIHGEGRTPALALCIAAIIASKANNGEKP